MAEPIYLLYLDDIHLCDPLFLQGLAREMRGAPPPKPMVVLVHGSGEPAERRLEGEGIFRERVDGILQINSAEEALLVDQVTRDTNRRLVAMLTDQVIPAVSVQGDDRRLLQVSDHGEVIAGSVYWLKALLKQGAIPVISALAVRAEGEESREIAGHDALQAIGHALGASKTCVVFFLRRNQRAVLREGEPVDFLSVSNLPSAEVVPSPSAVRDVVKSGLEVLLTNPTGLFLVGGPAGSRVLR